MSTQPKRKAAADVFKAQNVMMQEQVMEGIPPAQSVAPALSSAPLPPAPGRTPPRQQPPADGLKTSEELQLEKEPLRVRETGFWLWKRIIVPPNAYVVHTRLGRKEPVTIGLGISFRYNPETDAYLIVPAAMQTIGVVANCIGHEKQGINILAYVQWQIDDFSLAYRKLDLSDSRDPLGIVNAQLREQAEAAIKDKIATMSVEEVLTDKAPIIEELTARLKEVAEGRRQGGQADDGLGIKIVTVQIKEALVSSQRLWEDLQAPFRHEKAAAARISQLAMQSGIQQKELAAHQLTETSEAETMAAIERITQSKQTEAVELRLAEEGIRFEREQEAARRKLSQEEETTRLRQLSEQRLYIQTAQIAQEKELAALLRSQEKVLAQSRTEAETAMRRKTIQVEQALQLLAEDNRLAQNQLEMEQKRLERETTLKKELAVYQTLVLEQEQELERQKLSGRIEREQQEHQAKVARELAAHQAKISQLTQEIGLDRTRQEILNLVSESDLMRRLIEQLPKLASELPDIQEYRVLQTGGDPTFDALSAFVSKVLALAENLGIRKGE